MIFADDEQANKTASLKFLQLAAEWKRKVRPCPTSGCRFGNSLDRPR